MIMMLLNDDAERHDEDKDTKNDADADDAVCASTYVHDDADVDIRNK